MTVTTTSKLDIAAEMLARSIELFLRGDSYHSALHLAGAAEELLNVYARSIELPDGTKLAPSFDQMKMLIVEVFAPKTVEEKAKAEKWAYDRLSDPKNSVKHMRGPRDLHFTYDTEQEAEDVIGRAIATYLQVNKTTDRPLVELIVMFDRVLHGNGAA